MEKKVLKSLESSELEQMLYSYNTIVSIYKKNLRPEERAKNQIYIDAVCGSTLVWSEIQRRTNDRD